MVTWDKEQDRITNVSENFKISEYCFYPLWTYQICALYNCIFTMLIQMGAIWKIIQT